MKVWMTKYALSSRIGIKEVEAEVCSDVDQEMVRVKELNGGYLHGEGKNWHKHEYDALERGILMADKKMASLKRQIRVIEMEQARWRNRRDQIRSQA